MAMNMHLESTVFLSLSKDSMKLNLLVSGNSPDAKPSAALASLDISASAIASAPLPHSSALPSLSPEKKIESLLGKTFRQRMCFFQ
jgi:predicted dinucleotide-binding enzyme